MALRMAPRMPATPRPSSSPAIAPGVAPERPAMHRSSVRSSRRLSVSRRGIHVPARGERTVPALGRVIQHINLAKGRHLGSTLADCNKLNARTWRACRGLDRMRSLTKQAQENLMRAVVYLDAEQPFLQR